MWVILLTQSRRIFEIASKSHASFLLLPLSKEMVSVDDYGEF